MQQRIVHRDHQDGQPTLVVVSESDEHYFCVRPTPDGSAEGRLYAVLKTHYMREGEDLI